MHTVAMQEREGLVDAATLYDGHLQMFRQPGRQPDLGVLRFLRWLAEQGRLEHETFGDPTGELAESMELVPA
jgi:hypothetical protein